MGFRIKQEHRELLADIINAGMKEVCGCVAHLPIEIDCWLEKQGIKYVDMNGLAGFKSKYYTLTDEAIDERKKWGIQCLLD